MNIYIYIHIIDCLLTLCNFTLMLISNMLCEKNGYNKRFQQTVVRKSQKIAIDTENFNIFQVAMNEFKGKVAWFL